MLIKPPSPEPLGNLVREFHANQIAIPPLQRNRVWDTEDVKKLLESLNREFPIGSFFLWKEEADSSSESVEEIPPLSIEYGF
jgi:uncharacterized protein with ParB-like and HNH nuclease domain